jgi:hypothetical protein
MIVNKIYTAESGYVPDLSNIDNTIYEVGDVAILPCGEKYEVQLQWIADFPEIITNGQCRMWLIDNNLLQVVDDFIKENNDMKLLTLWEYSTTFYYVNNTLQQLAEHFNIDLKQMFTEASKIPA